MNFSLWLWPYQRWGGIETMGAAATLAEDGGFASVSVSDHTIATTGPESAGAGPVWPDWSVLSTYLATRTTTIRILSCLVVPYRPVLSTAKQIATVDQISGGRFTLAAAIGWLEREFQMLGVSHADRGAITDEYLRAMRALWTEEEPSFSGEHVSFSDIVFEPKCAQSPHVPIWIAGGTGLGPIGRLLEIGDGWMPMGGDPDHELREKIVEIKERAANRGRDPDSITFRYTIGIGEAEEALEALSKSIDVDDPSTIGLGGGSPAEIAEAVTRFEDAGFTELAINFAGRSAGEVTERLESFIADVMPLLDQSGPAAAT